MPGLVLHTEISFRTRLIQIYSNRKAKNVNVLNRCEYLIKRFFAFLTQLLINVSL